MNILLKNSIGKIIAVEFVFIAFLTVATQLQSKDLMQMIIGQTLQGEIFVVATAFTGFLIGLSIHLNRHLKMFLYGLAAVFQLVLCLYYDFIAEQSLISSWFGIVVFAMCTLSIVLAAIILAEFLYNPKFDLSRYIQIQKFAFYSAAAILFLTFFADKQIVYFFMALSFFSAAFRSSQVKPKQIRQPLKLNRNSFEATVWGFASGCATNYFFNFYHSMVYPTGLEFYFYILILFLYLYVSGLILKKHNFKIKLFEGYVAAAAILFIATTIVVLTNLNGKFYFDPLQLTTSLVFSYYPFFIFFILLILMSPYLIISFTVPVLQSENENVNYMFFTTLGSCLIQYIFLIPIFNISLHGRFFFLVGFLLMAYFLHSKNQKKRWSLGLCSLILIGLASLSWPELESRLVVQARRFHDAYWIPVEFRRRMIQQGNSFNEVDILKRVGGKIGALGG
ncbi:MAG: hypothetical protein K2P92_06985, partial [Bdellovibrionaceae bacterium]|nr:hypothetical protein [Pseudobdellovibrionaceae bacterium]